MNRLGLNRLALVGMIGVAVTACGSSDSQAATASKGDNFCSLAQVAKDDNDNLDSLDPTDPAAVKVQLSGAIDSLAKVAAAAPKDVATTVNNLLANEVKLENLLKADNYDFAKLAASAEGKKLLNDDSISKIGADFDSYLSDKCGIASDTTVATSDTAAVTDTIATSDSIATDDTSAPGISIDFGEGAAAINKFLDFYEIGTGTKLSDTDRQCIVDALANKITGDDLNSAVAGGAPSAELQQTLGLAFIGCHVDVTVTT